MAAKGTYEIIIEVDCDTDVGDTVLVGNAAWACKRIEKILATNLAMILDTNIVVRVSTDVGQYECEG